MTTEKSRIIYTLTDEAPLLATCSLLPIIRTFTSAAGIEIDQRDISVAARILAEFSDYLNDDQKVPDNLAELGRLTQEPATNIIKLPNISAAVPQLTAAIAELQSNGYDIPDYPDDPQTEEEKVINQRYGKVQGSAVNPVLRQGNSDRRAPAAVKRYAQKNPHSMAKWSPASRTHVSHMQGGDFYDSEKCMTMEKDCDVKMELLTKSGETIVLKEKTSLLKDEIIEYFKNWEKAIFEILEPEIGEKQAKEKAMQIVSATQGSIMLMRLYGNSDAFKIQNRAIINLLP